MAFSFNTGTGRRKGGSFTAMAEINVVPLVDVVLVLLIIFMLTAHVMEFGMEVEVPQVNQVQDTAEDLPIVNVSRNGNLQLNESKIDNVHNLGDAVNQRFPGAKSVYLRADKNVKWEIVAMVMDALHQAHLDIKAVMKPLDSAK